jgi:hypothetical protein
LGETGGTEGDIDNPLMEVKNTNKTTKPATKLSTGKQQGVKKGKFPYFIIYSIYILTDFVCLSLKSNYR